MEAFAQVKPKIAGLAGIGVVFQVFNVGMLLLSTVLVSRVLGVAEFGKYVVVLAATMLASTLISFGLPSLLIREISSAKERGGSAIARLLLRFAYSVCAALFSIVALGVLALSMLVSDALVLGAGVGPLVFVLGKCVHDIQGGALISFGRVKQGQAAQLILTNGPFLVILAVLILLGESVLSLKAVFSLQAAGIWLSALISMVWMRSALRSIPRAVAGRIRWVEWLRAAVPLTLINGLAAVQQNVVFLILGFVALPETVAIYRIAERIAAVASFFRAAFERVLQPIVARNWVSGRHLETTRLMRQVCLVNAMYNSFLFLLFLWFGEFMIVKAFGSDYMAASIPLSILLGGYSLASIFGFNGMVLSMTAHAEDLLKVLVLTLILLVGMLLALSSEFAEVGVAIATSVYIVATAVLLWRMAIAKTGMNVSLLAVLGSKS